MQAAVTEEGSTADVRNRGAFNYRPHLDGLRAIAVYLVVAFHAGIGWLKGGFVGVDVFFVLSGFLVTRILIRDLARAGRIQWRQFYARRVRRILPAAIVVLVVTAFAYAVVATPSDMLDSLGGFRAALFYVGNWYFIHQATNYFATDVNSSPVLHFWSLAVEEQFYLLWPLTLGVLYVATGLVGRYRWWTLRGVVVVAAIASAVAALHIASTNLPRAYYGTDTRAYQLLAGSALALTPQLWNLGASIARPARAVALAALGGLLFLGTSLYDVSPITRGILVAVCAGTLILALENAHGGSVKSLLSARPVSYLGRISYGTYLWHWPVIVIITYGRHVGPTPRFLIAIPISTALAAVSYHLLERPVRSARVLDRFRVPVIAIGFTTSILVGVLAMPAILNPKSSAVAAQHGSSKFRLLDWRVAQRDFAKVPDCLDRPIDECTLVRGTKHRVLLIGDSYAHMWMPALALIAERESLTLSVAVMDACPWQRGISYADLGPFTGAAAGIDRACKQHQADWYDRLVRQFKPDVVVLAQAQTEVQFPLAVTFPDGLQLKNSDPRFEPELVSASATTLHALQAPGRKIAVIEPTPPSYPFNPLRCLSGGGAPAHCAFHANTLPTALELFFRSAGSKVTALDLDRVVCPRLPTCDAVVNNVIVRLDANGHLTATFARSVSLQLEGLLHRRRVLGN